MHPAQQTLVAIFIFVIALLFDDMMGDNTAAAGGRPCLV